MRDVSHLEPAAVLTLFTWDGPAADQNHREIDIEISRWGNPAAKNAQYVVQPYYVAGERVAVRGAARRPDPHAALGAGPPRWRRPSAGLARAGPSVAEHTFTSGVPRRATRTVRMNLYAFRRSAMPLQRGTEVVIEKFEYLP